MAETTVIRDKILIEKEELSLRVLKKIWQTYPQLEKKYTAFDKARCKEDVMYHLMYIADSVGADAPELFINYVAWVKSLFTAIGVSNESFLASLKIIREELSAFLPESQREKVDGILRRGITDFPKLQTDIESNLRPENPYYGLAAEYLEALLGGKRENAMKMILDRAKEESQIKDLYIHVFQPVQQELGRLWQMNKISVAQEHYCTAVTQLVMSQLYPYIFSTDKKETVFIGACVGDELHEIGIRMLTDFLEMEGWDTYFLGANTPITGVLQSISEYKADIIGISATMTYHIHKVGELIAAIRSEHRYDEVKILAGGYPFNRDTGLWKKVGADGFARNADEAVEVGKKLLSI